VDAARLTRGHRRQDPTSPQVKAKCEDLSKSEHMSILKGINFGANLVPLVQPDSVDSALWQRRAESRSSTRRAPVVRTAGSIDTARDGGAGVFRSGSMLRASASGDV
jgi:hypothetical protein